MNLVERWNRWDEKWNPKDITEDTMQKSLSEFALRPDGALVFFDEDGWFLMVRENNRNRLKGADGSCEDFYFEDGWTWAYLDAVLEGTEFWGSQDTKNVAD